MMDQEIIKLEYNSPLVGRIPIVASSPYGNMSEIPNDEIFHNLKDCGFNIIHVTLSTSILENVLVKMEEIGGIYALVWNNLLIDENEKIHNFVNHYKKFSALGGWSISDEPLMVEFSNTSELYRMYKEISSQDKKHLIYINLYGGSGQPYKNYVNKFRNVFHPAFYSYDIYPVTKKSCNTIGSYIDAFYFDLEFFSNLYNQTGEPFWVYIQSMAWCNGYMNNYHPEASLAMIRFEVFASLAYGAQGISYWTYHQRPWSIKYKDTTEKDENGNELPKTLDDVDKAKTEIYFNALVDLEGNKTASWYYAQKVNQEVKQYTEVFLGCKCEECKQLYKNADYDSSQDSEALVNRLMSKVNIGALSHLTVNYNGVQISRLSNQDKNYLVIVNRDILNFQRVELHFQNQYKIFELTPTTSTGTANPDTPILHSISIPTTRTMPPGGYLIYRYE